MLTNPSKMRSLPFYATRRNFKAWLKKLGQLLTMKEFLVALFHRKQISWSSVRKKARKIGSSKAFEASLGRTNLLSVSKSLQTSLTTVQSVASALLSPASVSSFQILWVAKIHLPRPRNCSHLWTPIWQAMDHAEESQRLNSKVRKQNLWLVSHWVRDLVTKMKLSSKMFKLSKSHKACKWVASSFKCTSSASQIWATG